jgi:hypothetical protein
MVRKKLGFYAPKGEEGLAVSTVLGHTALAPLNFYLFLFISFFLSRQFSFPHFLTSKVYFSFFSIPPYDGILLSFSLQLSFSPRFSSLFFSSEEDSFLILLSDVSPFSFLCHLFLRFFGSGPEVDFPLISTIFFLFSNRCALPKILPPQRRE